MNLLALHLAFLFALFCCWLAITGRTAEWGWRLWGESRLRWLFLGWHFDDLHSFKRHQFWLGWLILAVVLFVYGMSMYRYLTTH